MSVAEIIISRRQDVSDRMKKAFSFVSVWADKVTFFKHMSAYGVPNPTRSQICAVGNRPVLWDGITVNLPFGFEVYEITQKVCVNILNQERETALVVQKTGAESPVTKKDLLTHIKGVANRPTTMLIQSGHHWKLLVASNGQQGFVIECQFL
jgi:hypothetical protein